MWEWVEAVLLSKRRVWDMAMDVFIAMVMAAEDSFREHRIGGGGRKKEYLWLVISPGFDDDEAFCRIAPAGALASSRGSPSLVLF